MVKNSNDDKSSVSSNIKLKISYGFRGCVISMLKNLISIPIKGSTRYAYKENYAIKI